MDVLKDPQTRKYVTLSRYSPLFFYYNTLDNKYIYGTVKNLKVTNDYILHTLTKDDTLESLALFYYGRPDYYWIISDFNRIVDPFMVLMKKYKTIKIPNISTISFGD